jgi:alkylated DNA repair dioxygenase AlkB
MAKSAKAPVIGNSQNDLFAGNVGAFAVDTTFRTASRVALDAHSWIEVVPGWISGAHILFERMRKVVPWNEHDRKMFDQIFREPRMTATYKTLDEVPDIGLREALSALSNHYGITYDSVWMNLYRSGQDSTAWHGDYHSCRKEECIVPVLTLGATRRFLIKPRKGGRSVAFKPGSGDLIVMGGRSQREWVHSVPKEPGIAQERISVNFQSHAQSVRDKRPATTNGQNEG